MNADNGSHYQTRILHAFIEASGRDRRGRHHEIYLSDFRRTAPERLRTILRQPVA